MSDVPPTKLDAAGVQAILDGSPFIASLGLKVVSVDHAKARSACKCL